MEFRKLFADERTTKNIVRSHGAIFNSNQYIRKKQTSDSIYCAPTIGRRRNRIILHITWPAFPRRDLKSKRIKRSLVIKNQTDSFDILKEWSLSFRAAAWIWWNCRDSAWEGLLTLWIYRGTRELDGMPPLMSYIDTSNKTRKLQNKEHSIKEDERKLTLVFLNIFPYV